MNISRLTLILLLAIGLAACGRDSLPQKSVPAKPAANEGATAAQNLADELNRNNASIAAQSHTSTSTDGQLYKADLLNAISAANRIVISEHSDENDYFNPETGETTSSPTVIYHSVELNAKQKAFFSSVISDLSNETQDAFAACIFEPHHSIEFYSNGKLSSKLDVCFVCGQVEWNGSTRAPPWSIYPGLARVVQSVGLSPKRDWHQLAVSGHKK